MFPLLLDHLVAVLGALFRKDSLKLNAPLLYRHHRLDAFALQCQLSASEKHLNALLRSLGLG